MAYMTLFSKMKTRGPRRLRVVLIDPGLPPPQLILLSYLSVPQQGSMLLQSHVGPPSWWGPGGEGGRNVRT